MLKEVLIRYKTWLSSLRLLSRTSKLTIWRNVSWTWAEIISTKSISMKDKKAITAIKIRSKPTLVIMKCQKISDTSKFTDPTIISHKDSTYRNLPVWGPSKIHKAQYVVELVSESSRCRCHLATSIRQPWTRLKRKFLQPIVTSSSRWSRVVVRGRKNQTRTAKFRGISTFPKAQALTSINQTPANQIHTWQPTSL